MRFLSSLAVFRTGKHAYQNECRWDEMLSSPAFTRHNMRSKARDRETDDVQFEGCSLKRTLRVPKRLFGDAKSGASANSAQLLGLTEAVSHRSVSS